LADNCSQQAVQDAINLAGDGDIVQVPAGACEWTESVVLDKGITVQGAGIDDTIIKIYNFLFEDVNNIRITGFTFDGDGLNGNGKSTQPIGSKNFRIDNCKYNNYDGHPIRISGYSSGVIDHCQFIDITSEGLIIMGDPLAADRPLVLGGNDGVIFIEDCDWSATGDVTRWWSNVLDGNYGARWVFRHNTITDHANNKLLEWIETHGFYRSDWGRGVLSFEVYGNTFTSPSATGWKTGLKLRGGLNGVIFNNAWIGPDWDSRTEVWLSNDRSGSYCRTHDNIDCCVDVEGYPCTDQISNLYIWNNTVNEENSFTLEIPDDYENRLHIQQDRDYFLYERPDYIPYPYPHPLTLN
ncbi:hypothetical protein KAJ87_04620, partial [Candidatus Pacearchaeota archaeon]|nr:hypothetical protein [Candidatus Pacearchaeota archaeon]